MIKIINASERFFSSQDWLKSYWLFSFDYYYDPQNIVFGRLRVFNDDFIGAHSGFPFHPHKNMEIISVALTGELTHQDTLGNKMTLKSGDVQRMTAGSGILHSEFNNSEEECHFLQIWLLPEKDNQTPSYDYKNFDKSFWHNKLTLIASPEESAEIIQLNTNANIYRSELEKNKSVIFNSDETANVFIYNLKGVLTINGKKVETSAQARITGEKNISIEAAENSEFILIEMPQ